VIVDNRLAPTISGRTSPDRIAIASLRRRNSFAGHGLATPWDPLQRAYFNGYALWTYLRSPFFSRCRRFRCDRSTKFGFVLG
jgi:hypothetical protein